MSRYGRSLPRLPRFAPRLVTQPCRRVIRVQHNNATYQAVRQAIKDTGEQFRLPIYLWGLKSLRDLLEMIVKSLTESIEEAEKRLATETPLKTV